MSTTVPFDPKAIFLEEWARFTLDEVEPQLNAEASYHRMASESDGLNGTSVPMTETEWRAMARLIVVDLKTGLWQRVSHGLKTKAIDRIFAGAGLERKADVFIDVRRPALLMRGTCDCPGCRAKRDLASVLEKAMREDREASAKKVETEKASRN